MKQRKNKKKKLAKYWSWTLHPKQSQIKINKSGEEFKISKVSKLHNSIVWQQIRKNQAHSIQKTKSDLNNSKECIYMYEYLKWINLLKIHSNQNK